MVDIVLVDDCEMTRTALRLLLREAGFFVVGEARDGKAGMALVERLRPDIVCLDICMPEPDGFAVLERIKTAWPEIAILVISGNADPESVKQALSLGAAGFVIKPFNSDRVVKSLRSVLRGGTCQAGS